MTEVLSARPRGEGSMVVGGGGGVGAAAVVAAALNHGYAGGGHGGRRRRGDGRAAAVTPVVVGAGREHGVHRADTGARGDLAVAGVRHAVCLAGRQQSIAWCGGGGIRCEEQYNNLNRH